MKRNGFLITLVGAVMLVTSTPAGAATSPVAHWRFDEGSGSTAAVAKNVKAAFGDIDVSTNRDEVAYPLTGKAADVKARGWAIAQYLVGNASHLKISTVTFGGRAWSAEDSGRGWVHDTDAEADTVRVTTR